jgi:hypothetical protein
VQAADVVDLIDKAWKVGGDIFERLVIHQIGGFDFKRLHKALGLGIVVGIAAPAHGADQTMFGEYVASSLNLREGKLRKAKRSYEGVASRPWSRWTRRISPIFLKAAWGCVRAVAPSRPNQ